MLCIFAIFVFAVANSANVLTNEENEGKYFKRSIERLAKVLSPSIISPSSESYNEMEFYADFYSEAVRYNISTVQYARTCYDAYVEMKLSPAEADVGLISSDLQNVKIMMDYFRNPFPDNWENKAPIIYLALTSRISIWNDLASKAPLQLQEFAKNIENKTKEAVHALVVNEEVSEILYVPRRPMWLFDATEAFPAKVNRSNEARVQLLLSHLIVRQFVREVANEYKKLSPESKADMERHFCLHSVLRWLNSDWNGALNELYLLFWQVVGVNVDHLMRGNNYLSDTEYPVQNVTQKFVKKAEEIHMPAQEYVDLCTEVYAVMNLSSEERQGIAKEDGEILVSKNWGSRAYSNNEDFEQALLKEGAPFIQTFSKRWEFVEKKLQQYEIKTGPYLLKLKDHVWTVVRDMNNRRSWNGTRQIKFYSEGMFHMDRFIKLNEYLGRRELEQFFCFENTVESVLGRAINFDEFELNRGL